MPDDKLYCYGSDNHINKRHDIRAKDDLAALDRAEEICGPDEVEVWQGARLAARVKADGKTTKPPRA